MQRMFVAAAGSLVIVTMSAALSGRTADQQSSPPSQSVDFARDVQPIFRQSCYGCHGPSQQMNGFRLDRRKDALRGGTLSVIGPGNSEASRLYLRLLGNAFGQQMPPTGALPPAQIATIKAWIDQGAIWPDAVSGEVAPTPQDPSANGLIALLRSADFRSFQSRAARETGLGNVRGPGGSTLLMFAALYGDVATVRGLLDRGASVNMRNDAGATALMWAAADVEKTRLLIDRGADINARSDDGRTPLMIAAGRNGNAATVKLLLERGASVNVAGPSLLGQTTPLIEAALAGDAEIFQLLVSSGANLVAGGPAALGLALRAECMACAEVVLKALPPPLVTASMMLGAPPIGPAVGTPFFLERGADITARDESGRSILMLAAASEAMPVDAIKALLARKMDINERTPAGQTALALARRHGQTPVVQLLRDAGAVEEPLTPAPTPTPARSTREALARTVPLLQKTDVTFLRKSGCVSCHNNSLTAITVGVARKQGFKVDEAVAVEQTRKVAAYIESWRERTVQGIAIPGDVDTVSYILAGLAADGYPADLATDAQAYLIKRQQAADGRWRIFANRPPIESSDIEVTAASIRALQVYAPKPQRAEYDKAIAAGSRWLQQATARTTEDRAFQLLGLLWANAPKPSLQPFARALVAEQRPDGGWSQLPTLTSDAYATGQALVALVQSGAIAASDPVYQRGIAFLMQTQQADGSWFVRTRAIPIQPLFDAGFPHGPDAFISAAASNWAAMALALAEKTSS
jgi:ankyrin repeat protein/mono/diheme cytochrome c family protein